MVGLSASPAFLIGYYGVPIFFLVLASLRVRAQGKRWWWALLAVGIPIWLVLSTAARLAEGGGV